MRRHRRRLFTRVLLALTLLSASIIGEWAWREGRRHANPEWAFRTITGRALPSGVRATAYAHAVTDNWGHTTHYWLLTGSPDALRALTSGTGFAESDDARCMLPDTQRLFGVVLTQSDVVAGYEWELGRDRWYCIFAGEATALYAH